MEFRVLGPLEVRAAGRELNLGGLRQQRILAALLLNANRTVSLSHLVTAAWEDAPPTTARRQVQNRVALLRSLFNEAGKDLISRSGAGYLLRVGPDELDALVFDRLVAAARAAADGGEGQRAARLLREALALWRGPALAGLGSQALEHEAAGLEEKRLAALEDCLDLELAAGEHGKAVAELRVLVARHPSRERLVGQLMVALFRGGRQAEALAAYHELAGRLAEELGLDPGPELRRLYEAVLREDPALSPDPDPDPGAVAAGRAAEAPVMVNVPVAHRPDAAATGRGRMAKPAGQTGRRSPRSSGRNQEAQARPAQLPADVSAFTGRHGYLDQLDRLLAAGAGTAVVITAIAGTAGVGKTALATHWAHRVRERFPDGQLYMNLQGYASTPPLRPTDGLAQFLRALGVPPERVPVDVEEAAALYRSLLDDRQMMVLLDNARSSEQVRPLLPGSPGCVVLVTSREPLAGLVALDGAHRVTLDVLTPDEAQVLLGRVLGANRVRAEPAAVAELARLCAYLPLALRIAAANLGGDPRHTVASYAAALSEGNRLGALGVEGDERAVVRAAFDLSYAALPAPASRLFRRLGLLPGPDVTAEAAAVLADVAPDEAARLLARLAEAHLLDEHRPGRFAFHELLRLYAAEGAAREHPAAEREAATGRLLDWYLAMVDAAARLLYPEKIRHPLPPPAPLPASTFRDHTHASGWLDAERANLVAAVNHAAEHGPPSAAWLLADALRGYLGMRMYLVDWRSVAAAGKAAADASGDPRARAAAEHCLGEIQRRLGQFPQAREHYTAALELARHSGWLELQSAIVGSLADVYWQLGLLQEAAAQLAEAVAITARTGRIFSRAGQLSNLGVVTGALGRLPEAARYHAEALALHRASGARSSQALSLNNLGDAYRALGRLDEAMDHLSEGLALGRELGLRDLESTFLGSIAQTHRDAGRYNRALETASAAVALGRETGDRHDQSSALNTLGSILDRRGQLGQAISLYQEARCLAGKAGIRYQEAVALVGLSRAHRQLGEHDTALGHAREALAVARESGFRMLEGEALTAYAELHLTSGRADEAVRCAEQAVAVHRETGHRLGLARALAVLGRALRHLKSTTESVAALAEALDLFTDIGTPEGEEVRVLLRMGPASARRHGGNATPAR